MELSATLLTQLRAFDAVARTGSFKAAAEELFVTQSAISHHVKNLEDHLGTELLRRLHRRVEPTAQGRDLADGCARSFDTLTSAVQRIMAPRPDSHTLTITVAPYFSSRWLTPRLGRLWDAHPELNLRLHHAYEPVDFVRDDVDAGINWGHGRWADTTSVSLVTGELIAVCSPAFRRKLPTQLHPRHFLKHRLLFEFDQNHWRLWFAAMKVDAPAELQATRIDDSHALRRAALDGHGIALFFRGLLQEDLEQGLLVSPFDQAIDSGSAYFLTHPSTVRPSDDLRTLMKWIRREARLRPFA